MGNSNPYKQTDAVRDWAQHVDLRRQEAAKPDYGLVDKALAAPGDLMNWAGLKLRTLGGHEGQALGDGKFAYPDTTAQQLYKDYSANPNDERLRREWQDAVNLGRVNLQRSR